MTTSTVDQIPMPVLKTLRYGIELEGRGVKVKREPSCLAIVKKAFGWTGNRNKILALLTDHMNNKHE